MVRGMSDARSVRPEERNLGRSNKDGVPETWSTRRSTIIPKKVADSGGGPPEGLMGVLSS